MCFSNLLTSSGLLALAAVTVWLVARLFQRYPIQPLRFYVLSVGASLFAAFLRVIGNFIAQEFLWRQGASDSAHAVIAWVFRLLAEPFGILAVYFFILTILSFAARRFRIGWQAAFLGSQIVLAGLSLKTEYEALLARDAAPIQLADGLRRGFESANTVVLVGCLLALALVWLREPRLPWRAGIAAFAWIYIGVLAAGYLAVMYSGSGRAFRVVYAITAFSVHIGPLLYLRRYFRRHFQDNPTLSPGADRIAEILSRYSISSRETEIVRLLAQGMSYREIENRLCISLSTVKTHAYNIYRKMGIQRRWQLLRILQSLEPMNTHESALPSVAHVAPPTSDGP